MGNVPFGHEEYEGPLSSRRNIFGSICFRCLIRFVSGQLSARATFGLLDTKNTRNHKAHEGNLHVSFVFVGLLNREN